MEQLADKSTGWRSLAAVGIAVAMVTLMVPANIGTVLLDGAQAASSTPTTFDDGGDYILDETHPLHATSNNVTVTGGSTLILDGISLEGTVHVEAGSIRVVDESHIRHLWMMGTSDLTTEDRLEIRQLTAEQQVHVDGTNLHLTHPPHPEDTDSEDFQERFEAWITALQEDPPFVVASEETEITIASLAWFPISFTLAMADNASLTALGTMDYAMVQMADQTSLQAPELIGRVNASGHSTVRITEDAPWTSLELHDDAAAWVDDPGAPRGVFNLYLHDRANATLSSLQGGSYRHLGSGVLTIKDTVVPMEFGSQREVRIWLPSPESRTIFENVETLPGAAWFPGCWAVCPPLYGILATDAGYLRAVNSSLHLELLDEGATVGGVAEPRVHWLELEDSVAYNVNGPVSYQDGFTQNSGECAVLRGTSATNHRYDDQCVGLDVRVEDEEGQAIAGASLRMVSETGEPIDSYDFQANEALPDRTTDEDGHASFAFAPRGEPFTLEVTSSQGTAEEQMVLVDDEQATVRVQ